VDVFTEIGGVMGFQIEIQFSHKNDTHRTSCYTDVISGVAKCLNS
jgi:hypothetical protein